jgi:hypothetical protein
MASSGSFWGYIVENIDLYLPSLQNRHDTRIPVFCKEVTNAGDWILYNRSTQFYERIKISAAINAEFGFLMSLEMATSVLPKPLMPSGPFGWYGNVFDLDEVGATFVQEIHWSGPWILVTKSEHELNRNLTRIFKELSIVLFAQLNRESLTLNELDSVQKIRSYLDLHRDKDTGLLDGSFPEATRQLVKCCSKEAVLSPIPHSERWIVGGLDLKGFQLKQ